TSPIDRISKSQVLRRLAVAESGTGDEAGAAANRRKGSVFWKYAQPLLRVAPRGSDSTRVFAPAVALTNTSDFSNVKSSNLQSPTHRLLAKHFGTSATLRKIKATDESTCRATPFGRFIR